MIGTDYSKEIEEYEKILRKFCSRPSLYNNNENELFRLEATRYSLLFEQIHEYYAELDTDETERSIQKLIKSIFVLDINVCKSKMDTFLQAATKYQDKSKNKKLTEYLKKQYEEKAVAYYGFYKKWEQLHYDFLALVAFRSLEHFALLWEYNFKDKEKIFEYSIDPNNDNGFTGVNKPFLYYFNQMVLQKDLRFISKQMPTGYGKSLTNNIAIAWLFGVNPDNDVLLVLGNPRLVGNNIDAVVSIMTAPFFGKVFPKYAKFFKKGVNTRDEMFSQLSSKGGMLTISISKKVCNLYVISKDTPIDGVRVRFLFLDDICRAKDAENNAQHEKDIYNFWASWWKRNYNTNDFYIVAGGTAYSIYDILSVLIRHYSKGTMVRSAVNKYSFLSKDKDCAFIKIPKLDFDTDESTYPHRFPTNEARDIRRRDYRSFMAMEQQLPLAPETTPFYWDNLALYDTIPTKERSPYCWAAIDPVRVGGDNFAMPIVAKIGDFYFLVDCIYEAVEQEKIYQKVVDKIIQHRITKIVIEKNVDTSLGSFLRKMLKEQGVGFCEIEEVYNYLKKEERITNMQNTIKTLLRFPAEHLYGRASEMGRFMFDIVTFTWRMSSNLHDDSIDAITLFCEHFILKTIKKFAKFGTFKR